ncbi:MAG: phospholipase D-like domain-containing protein [Smithellaceae bacterium]|jgi:phosphatidylserine/phosphatidylglycerophosphate/cardiolipin synthase-like enzyme
MSSFDSGKKNIVVALCGLIFVIASLSSAFAGEKLSTISSGQSGCQAILLTNEAYFPALLKVIDEAQSEIFMSIFSFKAGVHKNSYPDRILGHLAKAVKRGVKVIVILETTGNRSDELNIQNRETGKLLEEKGVQVYFDSPYKTTHTKLIVIDQRLVLLGSHNLTQASMKYNNEASILLDSSELAQRARDYLLTIMKEAK